MKSAEESALDGFQKRFPNEQACWDYMVRIRWPQGCRCPKHRRAKVHFKPSTRLFECSQCGWQVSATAGTILHKSRVPLKKWFEAVFLMGHSTHGISMRHLQQHLGIKTYRTVWLMGHKIRHAMLQLKKGPGFSDAVAKDNSRFLTFEQLAAASNAEMPSSSKNAAKGSSNWVQTLDTGGKRVEVSTYHGCFPKYRKSYLAEFAYRHDRRKWPLEAFDRLMSACLQTKQITLNELRA